MSRALTKCFRDQLNVSTLSLLFRHRHYLCSSEPNSVGIHDSSKSNSTTLSILAKSVVIHPRPPIILSINFDNQLSLTNLVTQFRVI
uniref:Uncharacterized protein n=1 Tax=Kalanchoe fedtschenkoi TaxID=63787 RepID=A0A7N0UW87_KALFE